MGYNNLSVPGVVSRVKRYLCINATKSCLWCHLELCVGVSWAQSWTGGAQEGFWCTLLPQGTSSSLVTALSLRWA